MKNSATIIPVSSVECHTKSWKNELKTAFSNRRQLLQYLNIVEKDNPLNLMAEQSFAVRVPLAFAKKMKKGQRNDPLLLQVLSQDIEMEEHDGYSSDPLAEQSNSLPGMIHKYHGRVLLLLTGACAVNCRYCFRRHFPYKDQTISKKHLDDILAYLKQNSTITEVIFSGGDPLLADDKQLRQIIEQLANIPHIKRLRIHSRLPIVIPSRITQAFINLLSESRFETSLVVHINHPNEIDNEVGEQLQRLVKHGITLLNQSVLLKSINDDCDTLVQLSERLFRYQILPYYLHLLDPVKGSAHFNIPKEKAVSLFRSLQTRLPGYLVPRLAVEEPQHPAKTLIL